MKKREDDVHPGPIEASDLRILTKGRIAGGAPKIASFSGGSWPPPNIWFLWPPESITRTTFRSVHPFL